MPEQRNHDERDDATELDLDIRLAEVWQLAFGVEDTDVDDKWDLEMIGIHLRAAYMQSYFDASTEAPKGQLLRPGYRATETRSDGREANLTAYWRCETQTE